MRPLRWGLPVVALLLIAPVLNGQRADAPDREPFFQALTGNPPLTCSLPSLDPCTPIEEKWSSEVELPEGLTTLVLEVRSRDLTDLPVPLLGANDFLFRARTPGGTWLVALVTPAGDHGQSLYAWPLDAPAAPGTWRFEAFATWGGYNAFHVHEFEFGITSAFWGYQLPDDYSAFPDSWASEKSQTLLENLDLSADKVPCASSSSTTAVNGRIASGAC